jgi:nicotinate-nucleotide--dimethylbenzimidazole phosphoribosyltransferase
VQGARRDVRRYRPDDVPADTLERVLTAGHRAPSVGHSQPWRFVLVRATETRERAAVLADRERIRQAALLDPDAGRRLLDLQLEGIREAPLGIVVCCDRRTAPQGVLGRATFPDADLWSCACAIQNLWLAARAEGLGMGWVTLFEPADLAQLLHLPDGVVTLGWLCLGWPDERPPTPGLERAGWSVRQQLSDVVLEEGWPESDDAPKAPVSWLRAPEPGVVVGVRDDADALLTPPGSLGVLDRALARALARWQASGRTTSSTGTLILAAADHPVTHLGVSAFPQHITADVLSATLAGSSLGAATASAEGFTTIAIDAGVAGTQGFPGAVNARPEHPRGDLASTDALDPRDATRLQDRGYEIGHASGGEHGLVVLGEVGIGNTTVAAAVAAALLGSSGAEVVGHGAGADSAMVVRKRGIVDAALFRLGVDRTPERVLQALGGGELAVLVGVVRGAADSGAVVVLDGLLTGVAALIAMQGNAAVAACLVAGQRSREPAHPAVLAALGLEPLLDLRLRAGEGVGGCLAAGMLLRAAVARAAVARTSPDLAPRSPSSERTARPAF